MTRVIKVKRAKKAKKAKKWGFALLTGACGLVLASVAWLQAALPDSFAVSVGGRLTVGKYIAVSPAEESLPAELGTAEGTVQQRLSLFGLIPIKRVTVRTTAAREVTVCGTPFGIKLYMDGVLVVGLADVVTAAGAVNPATAAGVVVGDTVVAVNGQSVTTNEDVASLMNRSEGRPVTVRLRRDGVEFDTAITPVRPANGTGWRAGMWVRDSTAGIGTLTFYDPETGAYGGLGHPVCDSDTGAAVSVSGGEIVPARIYGVEKSVAGTPGELCGGFEPGRLGNLMVNSACGLFGKLDLCPAQGMSMPVALWSEVHTGAAELLTTVEGQRPRLYAVEIVQLRTSVGAGVRNMVVRVTDAALLAETGGVVQGMSGSPLLQDGKLVGALTHVLVDEPEKGYAIFADSMLEAALDAAEATKAAS